MLPKKVYVWEEESSDGQKYLMISKNLQDGPEIDGEKIGIYELKEIKTMKVEISLE